MKFFKKNSSTRHKHGKNLFTKIEHPQKMSAKMEFYVSIGCVFTKLLFLILLQNFRIKFACFFVTTHTYACSLTFRNQLGKNKFSLFFANFSPFTFKTEIFNFANIFFFHFNTHRLRVRFLGKISLQKQSANIPLNFSVHLILVFYKNLQFYRIHFRLIK